MSDCSNVQVPPQLLDAESVAALAQTFRVLGDSTRVRILDALWHGERCVGDLAALLGMTESAVSHQLRLLRDMRLVRARRAGQMVFYALDDHHVVRLFAQGLEHVQERIGTIASAGRARAYAAAHAAGREG